MARKNHSHQEVQQVSITQEVMDAILQRLRESYDSHLAIDYFPDNPETYRLNHPVGAILLGFAKSTFGQSQALDGFIAAREIVLPLTLMFRKLNGADGVVEWLDKIRGLLTGWVPPHAEVSLVPISEQFISINQGVWQFAQDWSVRLIYIQQDFHHGGFNELNHI